MTTEISTADARKHLADIVNRVVYGDEPIILTRRGQKVAALVSMDEFEVLRLLEDYIDIEQAKKALSEPGDNIAAHEVWKQLGL